MFNTEAYLHSNMVRFIIMQGDLKIEIASPFTFQYGQIYYVAKEKKEIKNMPIYIPIWLDLLLCLRRLLYQLILHLHSNMVRFIIKIYSIKV